MKKNIMNWFFTLGMSCLAILFSPVSAAELDSAVLKAMTEQGEAAFMQYCSVCHDHPRDRIPARILLEMLSTDFIVGALTHGNMQPMAAGLEPGEIDAVATFLTGAIPGMRPKPVVSQCVKPGAEVRIAENDWPSVDRDLVGSRYQANAGLTAADVPRLKLKWAFSYGYTSPGPPVVAGGRLFLPMENGVIQSLDATSGCSYWSFEAERQVRMVTLAELPNDQVAVFFGDDQGFVTALDASTGALIWKTQVDDHPLVRLTSPPMVSGGQVFVPISSLEDPMTHDPSYACCTFRGGVAALNALTGERQWKSQTIEQENKRRPHPQGGSRPYFSPAGGAIFTPLTIDVQRKQVYAATAESYNEENPAGSYSVIAFDMATGKHNWQKQLLPAPELREQICDEVGDTDCRNLYSFSTQVALHPLADGKEVLVVGQKWGYAYGLNPDSGALLWESKVARGGDLGGLQYGFSVAEGVAYISISDIDFGDYVLKQSGKAGGLAAVDVNTGKTIWRANPVEPVCSWGKENCSSGQVSATTAIPGVVFSGAWDGHMRAYSMADGRIIWDVDTAVPVQTINQDTAVGGHIAGWPVQVVNGVVYVTSGASAHVRPGNSLLVYTVDGK